MLRRKYIIHSYKSDNIIGGSTMKIRATAKQKNVIINKDMYTVSEINRMLLNNEIVYFKDSGVTSREPLNGYDDITLRIFTSDLTDLKIICEDGYYETVAIGKNGVRYYVEV